MDENNNIIEEQEVNPLESEELKAEIMAQLQSTYNDGMIVGFQTACHTALNRIYAFERTAGKKSANDYKRCIKDLKQFFETGISLKANIGAAAEQEKAGSETVQN